jgi:hypothetical protein
VFSNGGGKSKWWDPCKLEWRGDRRRQDSDPIFESCDRPSSSRRHATSLETIPPSSVPVCMFVRVQVVRVCMCAWKCLCEITRSCDQPRLHSVIRTTTLRLELQMHANARTLYLAHWPAVTLKFAPVTVESKGESDVSSELQRQMGVQLLAAGCWLLAAGFYLRACIQEFARRAFPDIDARIFGSCCQQSFTGATEARPDRTRTRT